MKKLLVLYYSRSGNTEKMAKAVAQGAQIEGVQVDVNYHVDSQDLVAYDAIAIGAPTYNHDMPVDFKNLFQEVAAKNLNLKGKVTAVFGSYGWSGEAPKLLTEILKNQFGMRVIEPPLIAKYAPDENALTACKDLGKKVSETLMNTP
jgi:NADH oxidase (H2O-forming)